MDGYSYVRYADEFWVRGLSQGMSLFLVEMRIHYRTPDGYEGTKSFPTMYTVGGNKEDAITNTVAITRPQDVAGATGYTLRVENADPDSTDEPLTVRYPDELIEKQPYELHEVND